MGERVCVGVLCMCHRTFALCEKGLSLTRQVSRGKSHEASLTKQVSRNKSHLPCVHTIRSRVPWFACIPCQSSAPPPILLPIVPSRRTEDVSDRCTFLLRAGDVVEMWGECQQQYQHSVLVEAAAELARPRISLVYKRTLEAEQRLSPGERPEWDDHAAQGLKSPWGGELEQPTGG